MILSLQKLAKKYGETQLEFACGEVQQVAQVPTTRIIERLLSNQKKKMLEAPASQNVENDYGFTRGAEYFGRISHDQSRND